MIRNTSINCYAFISGTPNARGANFPDTDYQWLLDHYSVLTNTMHSQTEADLEAEDWGVSSSLSSSSSFPFSSSSFLPPPFQLWLEIVGGAPIDFMELGGLEPPQPHVDPPLVTVANYGGTWLIRPVLVEVS